MFRLRLPSASWFAIVLAGIFCSIFGALVSYSGYQLRELWLPCINGGTCPIQSTPAYEQAIYGSIRAELDFGIIVLALGIGVVIYSVIFYSSYTKKDLVSITNPELAGNALKPMIRLRNWFLDRTDAMAVICLYIVLTILMTWPLAENFTSFINGGTADVFHELWFLHLASTLPYGPFFAFYTNYILYPFGVPLFFQVVSPFNTLIFMGVSSFFGEIVAYNTLYMFTFVAAAFTMYVLVHYLTDNKYAALFAGIVFGFAPIHTGEGLSHLNIMSSEFLPLFAYFLIKMSRQKQQQGWSNAIYAGIAFVLNAMCDIHMLFMAMFILLAFLAYSLFVQRHVVFNKLFIMRLMVLMTVAVSLTSLMYFQTLYGLIFSPAVAGGGQGYTPLATSASRAGDILAFLIPPWTNPLFVSITAKYYHNFLANINVEVYIGYTVLALSILGLIVKRRSREIWFWLALAIFGFLMAVGPYIEVNGQSTFIPGLWQWFYNLFPLFRALRTPYRFDYLLMLGLAVLSGYGVSAIMSAIGKSRIGVHSPKYSTLVKAIAISLLCVMVVAEFLPIPYSEYSVTIPAPYYQILANDHSNFAVLEVPMIGEAHIYLYYQSAYNKPLLNGRTSRNTVESVAFTESTPFLNQMGVYIPGKEPNPDILKQNLTWTQVAPFILAQYNIKYVIVHKDFREHFNYTVYSKLVSQVLGMPIYEDNQIIMYEFNDPAVTGLAQVPATYNLPFYDFLFGQWYTFSIFGKGTRAMEYYANVNVYSASNQYMSLQFRMEGLPASYPIEVLINGQLIGTYLAAHRQYNVYSTPFIPVQKGFNQIMFYSPNGCASPIPNALGNGLVYKARALDCASAQFSYISTVAAS